MKSNVIQHPSASQRQSEIHARFDAARKQHDAAVNRMWAGTLALLFTDEELQIIDYLLCDNDRRLMQRIHNPAQRTKTLRTGTNRK